ncbi:ABC transporter permease subunit [Jeotgalibacillus sp. ET6]|uniref:ABC transporter permease n=1 Tax=Jeotgalibacillus sp. ET6 TaxID=3037260 RepID=UPI002418A1A5|nr:ABC transporter permease subunit [Jeotgalibacillus sp. ET6]MDG5472117.1 ABC transporter permease subunit [Jeotgalibacillus sp. ET6]
MYVIAKREFFSLFKSIKSIIVIAILFLTSFYSAKYSGNLLSEVELSSFEQENIYSAGLMLLILLFGMLFVTGLSHDTINRETHERTIRFLVTRTSKSSIVAGKFFGILLFWIVCLIASFLLISVFSQRISPLILGQTMSLITYQIALTVLLSTIVSRPAFTMFLGVIVGIAFPIISFWLVFGSNSWFGWIKFITPFYYLSKDDLTYLFILPLAAALIGIATQLFKRREC